VCLVCGNDSLLCVFLHHDNSPHKNII
jgi:hypothetical protein